MSERPLRILAIGAHPDDADIKAGGTAAKWCAGGHVVQLVSLCDGSAGHQHDWGPALAERRRAEARASGAIIGARYDVWDFPDGELQPSLEARRRVIRLIRSFQPDVLLTHRPTDYHPDHCYTGLLVQEAAYMVTVPAICSDTPHLQRSPVILHFSDAFKKPCRFEPHVVVDIGDELDKVVAMLDCHESQFYEWLPYNAGYLEQVPPSKPERREWLARRLRSRLRPLADRYRSLVVQTYGPERGNQVEYIEAFEVSEYGAPLDAAARARLFPFLPATSLATTAFVRKDWVDIPEEE
ncbi:MAG TPA: PIG-L family deacetylase [Gemmataceae bacterium]|nr:PIG-L family deacetylase [Gemmataceae bacterium]